MIGLGFSYLDYVKIQVMGQPNLVGPISQIRTVLCIAVQNHCNNLASISSFI